MLELRNITKKYEVGTFKQTALNNLSLSFREKEFVCILGASGSGKTTLLNMIGGLDRFDDGDLLIDGKSTKHFKDVEWDAYRNHTIGFVFQNYNLISHTSVLANVEIGMTLSGLTQEKRKERAIEVLKQVGLFEHIYKKPNQLSGGQMQRVAIARALANNPDIILADEPTGALDSETSHQIMKLIQEISKTKLVIMVTHNEEVATTYSSRVVSLKDGEVISDTNPHQPSSLDIAKLILKQTSMAFTQALKLSFSNLRTKKFRTMITAFAGSIGIIGIALVLSLANGLNKEIERLEMTTLAEFPIQIDQIAFDLEAARQGGTREVSNIQEWIPFPEVTDIYPYEQVLTSSQHVNNLTTSYIDYVETLDTSLYHEIVVNRAFNMNVFFEHQNSQILQLNTRGVRFSPILKQVDFFDASYDILEGTLPQNKNELLLVVDKYNRLSVGMLAAFGLSGSVESYDFNDFLGKQFKVAFLDELYLQNEDTGLFFMNSNREYLLNEAAGVELTITGIARVRSDALGNLLSTGLKYHPDLVDVYLEQASTAKIGVAQRESATSVITGLPTTQSAIDSFLRTIGFDQTPTQIRIYPVSFEAKQAITEHLDAFNIGKEADERIMYTDLASLITELTADVIDGISYVLIAFSSISLLVSSIMIGIITYVSVLERTKEIGILRSLGARKRDISRVFNAETIIIGFVAGLIGVTSATLLTIPINGLINRLVPDVGRLAIMPIEAVIGLIIISIFLTFIAGLIPSSIASRKDPVEALRVD